MEMTLKSSIEWKIEHIEWKIEHKPKQDYLKYTILHLDCDHSQVDSIWEGTSLQNWVWRLPDYNESNKQFHCVGCGKRAPDYIITQWKLLEGK